MVVSLVETSFNWLLVCLSVTPPMNNALLLIFAVTEFLLGISSLYDGLGKDMQKLVEENKKKMAEVTKEK